MAWGSGPPGGSLRGTISLEGIPNLPGYRSSPMRPQKHRQTLQIRHGSMVVIGHRDPLPGSPGSTVRLDRSISRGSDARPARSFGDLTGRYSLIEQQKDALAAEEGKGRRLPFPKGQPLPKWLQYGKEQLTFKVRSPRFEVLRCLLTMTWVVSLSISRPLRCSAQARGVGAGYQRPGGAGASFKNWRHCGAGVHGARAHAAPTVPQGAAVFREIYTIM